MVNYSHKTLPDTVVKGMPNLVGLYIYSGSLESIPGGMWEGLVDFYVVRNRLKKLPKNIGNLKSLMYMDVSDNNLDLLPDTVTNLKELMLIYAMNNTLRNLPKQIGEMNGLKTVDFRNNRLENLPISIAKLPGILRMYLSGNPLCPDYDFPTNLRKATGICEQQCSEGCRAHLLGDGICNRGRYHIYNHRPSDPVFPGCNVASCSCDNGDCKCTKFL